MGSDKTSFSMLFMMRELIAATRHKVFSEHWSSEMTSQDGVVPAVPVLIQEVLFNSTQSYHVT